MKRSWSHVILHGVTNFVAAHELIIEACVNANLRPEELPEWFMILSDMQFNQAQGFIDRPWTTIHDMLGRGIIQLE